MFFSTFTVFLFDGIVESLAESRTAWTAPETFLECPDSTIHTPPLAQHQQALAL